MRLVGNPSTIWSYVPTQTPFLGTQEDILVLGRTSVRSGIRTRFLDEVKCGSVAY